MDKSRDKSLQFSDLDTSFILTPAPPIISSISPSEAPALQSIFSPEQLSYIQLLQQQIPGLPSLPGLQSLSPQAWMTFN